MTGQCILKRYIKQGDKLVETALAAQLEVSRTPVRGAIKRLVYEGFASYIPNKGACVISPAREEIEETFFVRRRLESSAARLAAERISPAQINILREAIKAERTIACPSTPALISTTQW